MIAATVRAQRARLVVEAICSIAIRRRLGRVPASATVRTSLKGILFGGQKPRSLR